MLSTHINLAQKQVLATTIINLASQGYLKAQVVLRLSLGSHYLTYRAHLQLLLLTLAPDPLVKFVNKRDIRPWTALIT